MFDAAARDAILERLAKLTPDAKGGWGKMNVGQMMCHCADGIDMATGDLAVKDRSNFVFRNIIRPLVIYLMPMPKSAPTADELNAEIAGTKPTEFETDRQRLIDRINHFTSLPEDFIWARHAAFGPLSRKEWGMIIHKHLDHHLKQFGG